MNAATPPELGKEGRRWYQRRPVQIGGGLLAALVLLGVVGNLTGTSHSTRTAAVEASTPPPAVPSVPTATVAPVDSTVPAAPTPTSAEPTSSAAAPTTSAAVAPVDAPPVTHAAAPPVSQTPPPVQQAAPPVQQAPPPAPAAATAQTACHPLTNGGKCYEPGELCRTADHGATGVAGDGEAITCEDVNGWRWERS